MKAIPGLKPMGFGMFEGAYAGSAVWIYRDDSCEDAFWRLMVDGVWVWSWVEDETFELLRTWRARVHDFKKLGETRRFTTPAREFTVKRSDAKARHPDLMCR